MSFFFSHRSLRGVRPDPSGLESIASVRRPLAGALQGGLASESVVACQAMLARLQLFSEVRHLVCLLRGSAALSDEFLCRGKRSDSMQQWHFFSCVPFFQEGRLAEAEACATQLLDTTGSEKASACSWGCSCSYTKVFRVKR